MSTPQKPSPAAIAAAMKRPFETSIASIVPVLRGQRESPSPFRAVRLPRNDGFDDPAVVRSQVLHAPRPELSRDLIEAASIGAGSLQEVADSFADAVGHGPTLPGCHVLQLPVFLFGELGLDALHAAHGIEVLLS